MTASDLHGLNIVDTSELSSSQLADLANTSAFPDLEAQLELWTNLAFQSDEPFIPRPSSPSSSQFSKQADLAALAQQSVQSEFDMTRFFTGFGIDPFAVAPSPHLLTSQDIAPVDTTLSSGASQAPDTSSFPRLSLPNESVDHAPPAKRARTRRSSAATTPSSEISNLKEDLIPPVSPMTPDVEGIDSGSPTNPNTTTPISAAEDKRRRNTAASARFRAKKKEREAALEKKSKELEGRVGELERECEALRRENGWLKGLVVGVTNAGNNNQATKRRRGEDGLSRETDLKDAVKA